MDGKSQNILHEQLAKLKEAFPEVVSENGIDWEKLKLTLGDDIALANERYVLNWAGKSEAFRAIQTQTTATLKPQREQSVDFDSTQNIFIEGENLEVLKVLQKSYYGKVKMIYIDPPYNTGNDSFIYPDKFSESKEEYLKRIGDKDEAGYLTKEGFFRKNSKENGQFHSNWLSMMYPRLFLARNLLRDDGVIFVSIDDNEVHNLRLVMNEIFGEENFVGEIVWQHSVQGKNDVKGISIHHNYLLVYGKSDLFLVEKLERTEEHNVAYDNPDDDPRGPWRSGDVRSPHYRKNLRFDIQTPSGKTISPPPNGWRWDEQTVRNKIETKEIVFVNNETRIIRKIYLADQTGRVPESIWFGKDTGTTREASQELKDLFQGESPFDTPKPERLVRAMMQVANVESNDCVLDFFAGSGTTAQAVLEQNKEDGGNRKFILVQLSEDIEEDSQAYRDGYKSIAEISKERIRRASKKIKEEIESQPDLFKDKSVDLGFKVFTLEPSNFKIWRTDVIETEEELKKQMEVFVDPVRVRSEADDMAWEILLKSGFELTTPMEKIEIGGAPVYSIAGGEVMLLLEAVTQEAINGIVGRVSDSIPKSRDWSPDLRKPKHVICLDRLFQGNDQLKTNTVLQMKDAGVEFRTI